MTRRNIRALLRRQVQSLRPLRPRVFMDPCGLVPLYLSRLLLEEWQFGHSYPFDPRRK